MTALQKDGEGDDHMRKTGEMHTCTCTQEQIRTQEHAYARGDVEDASVERSAGGRMHARRVNEQAQMRWHTREA